MPFCLQVKSFILESDVYIQVVNVRFIHSYIFGQRAGFKKQNPITHANLRIIRGRLAYIIETVFATMVIGSTESGCKFLVTFKITNSSAWPEFTCGRHPPKGATGGKIPCQFRCLYAQGTQV